MPKKRSLRIGTSDYPVIYTKRVPLRGTRIKKGGELWGVVDFGVNKIWVKDEVPAQRKRAIEIHEAVHAMFAEGNFWDECHNEDLVEHMAKTIYQVVRDNPWLVDLPKNG